jgi:uroporphyrinogen-III decarboxylase
VNFRERLLAVFEGKKPDCVPWFADLSWWYEAERSRGTLPKRFLGDGVVSFYRELGCGLYLPLVAPYRHHFDCESKERALDDTMVERTYTTPKGILREVEKHLPESFSHALVERLVKSADDIAAFRYLIESQRFEANLEEISRAERLYGGQGVVVVCLPRTPLSRMVVEFAGIEMAASAAMEKPELMHELVELMERMDTEAYRAAEQAEARFAMFPDNLSSEVIGAKLFREYSFDYYRRRIAQLRQAGKYTLTHLDGTIRGLLPVLAQTGIDCIEGLTPHPVGDVKVEELRELAGAEVVLWGGVPGAMFTPMWADKDVIQHTMHYVHTMMANHRFVLGIGDQLPPNGHITRVRAISNLVSAYGVYSG